MQTYAKPFARKSISRDNVFSVYYGKVSAWGHRAWDNAVVIYTDNPPDPRFNRQLREAEYATIYDPEGLIRALHVAAAYTTQGKKEPNDLRPYTRTF